MKSSFRKEELVSLRGKEYPVVGGRLRLAHEENKTEFSIATEIVQYDHLKLAIVRCQVATKKGSFSGMGVASIEKDRKLVNSLLELCETRSIARALRFAGYGVEYTGAEEMTEDIEDSATIKKVLRNQPTITPVVSGDSLKHLWTVCQKKLGKQSIAWLKCEVMLTYNRGSTRGLLQKEKEALLEEVENIKLNEGGYLFLSETKKENLLVLADKLNVKIKDEISVFLSESKGVMKTLDAYKFLERLVPKE